MNKVIEFGIYKCIEGTFLAYKETEFGLDRYYCNAEQIIPLISFKCTPIKPSSLNSVFGGHRFIIEATFLLVKNEKEIKLSRYFDSFNDFYRHFKLLEREEI